MNLPPNKPIQFPEEQAAQLESDAKSMGMTVPAYVQFLRNCRERQHDAKFADAARYVFKNYPRTLKKLAQ